MVFLNDYEVMEAAKFLWDTRVSRGITLFWFIYKKMSHSRILSTPMMRALIHKSGSILAKIFSCNYTILNIV